MSKLDPKHYLDYLDKEMTIMGILSAFCVAVVAALLNGIFTAAKGLWRSVARCGFWYGLVGSVFFLLAAFSFYVQRSHLAWLYGQISLCSSQGDSYRIFDDPFGKDDKREPPDLYVWFRAANAWVSWLWYRAGWAFVALGLFLYSAAFIAAMVNAPAQIWLSGAMFIVVVCGILVTRAHLRSVYNKADSNEQAVVTEWTRRFLLLGKPVPKQS